MHRITRRILSLGGVGLALCATTAAWGHRELTRFRLHDLTVPLLAPGTLRGRRRELRILHISDLHMIPGQPEKKRFVSGLAALDPDLVVNTGDNLSDLKGVPEAVQAIGPLLGCAGLFVFGTNDYFAPRPVNPFRYLLGKKHPPSRVPLPWAGMRATFIEHGWRDLRNSRAEFQVAGVRIAAAGVDDPHGDFDDYSAVAGPPNPDADLALALTHSPEPRILSRFAGDGYRLCLSGHTHGGQLCAPGGRALVTNCGIDRARASGLHRFGPMWMHVSNGLGTSKYVPFRIFCPPSATLLRITERDE